jgi:hypothetical protein
MKTGPDTNECSGVSLGSKNRSYEGVGKHPSIYPFFERLSRRALRG